MANFIKKTAVMTAVFMMFCVTTAAQSEKSSENARSGSYGVSVNKDHVVLFAPNGTDEVTVTLEVGYVHPYLVYGSNNFQINNNTINADSFTATISGNTITFRAKPITTADADVIYVRALKEEKDSNRSTRQVYGATITVSIYPSLNNKQSNPASPVIK